MADTPKPTGVLDKVYEYAKALKVDDRVSLEIMGVYADAARTAGDNFGKDARLKAADDAYGRALGLIRAFVNSKDDDPEIIDVIARRYLGTNKDGLRKAFERAHSGEIAQLSSQMKANVEDMAIRRKILYLLSAAEQETLASEVVEKAKGYGSILDPKRLKDVEKGLVPAFLRIIKDPRKNARNIADNLEERIGGEE